MSIGARTYNPQQLHEISTEAYHLAMTKIVDELKGETEQKRCSPDRLTALAAVADAAACEIMNDDDYDSSADD